MKTGWARNLNWLHEYGRICNTEKIKQPRQRPGTLTKTNSHWQTNKGGCKNFCVAGHYISQHHKPTKEKDQLDTAKTEQCYAQITKECRSNIHAPTL